MGRKQTFNDPQAIIDGAFELIKDEGFPNFSTRKLADKLGISKTTAYNYLQNKESIIELVVLKAYRILFEEYKKHVQNREYTVSSFSEVLIVMNELIFDLVQEYKDIYKLAYRDFSRKFNSNLPVEERFFLYTPYFELFIPDFRYKDFDEFSDQAFLDKFYFYSILQTQLSLNELDRTDKLGKEYYIRQVNEAWELIMEKPVPDYIVQDLT